MFVVHRPSLNKIKFSLDKWDIDGIETEQNHLCLILFQVQLKVNYFCLVLRLFTPDKRVGQLKLSPEPED